MFYFERTKIAFLDEQLLLVEPKDNFYKLFFLNLFADKNAVLLT